jgi:hypothetical protein
MQLLQLLQLLQLIQLIQLLQLLRLIGRRVGYQYGTIFLYMQRIPCHPIAED